MNRYNITKLTRIATCIFVITVTFISNSWAKNLYVSKTGSDSVAYANNDASNPWNSVSKAFSGALSGDVVYFRSGTYSIDTTISTRYSGAANVTFKNYPGESVTWTSPLTTSAIYIEKDYITVDGINIDAHQSRGETGFFNIGYYGQGGEHFTLQNATCTRVAASDNSGVVYARDENANYLKITNCIMSGGSSGGSGNTALIWMDYVQYAEVSNCVLYNSYCGIYYKHGNHRVAGTGPTIKNNFIYDCTRSNLLLTCNYATISNNIIAKISASSGIGVWLGQNGGERDNTGSDYNIWDHNTFYNCGIRFDCAAGTDPGATYNTVTNNLYQSSMTGDSFVYEYSVCSETWNATLDYNLYPSGSSIIHRGTAYTLSTWRAHEGQDANAVTGTPTFVGGVTPTTIAGFALTSGSIGKNAGSDGKDIGADVSLVGIKTAVLAPTTDKVAPAKPTDINIILTQ